MQERQQRRTQRSEAGVADGARGGKVSVVEGGGMEDGAGETGVKMGAVAVAVVSERARG